MGNCCLPSSAAAATSCKKEIQAEQALKLAHVETPIRFGAEGLRDCGFEYRQTATDAKEQSDLRLFHIESGVMISSQSRKTYIADGKFFDTVATCCQQIVQQRLQDEYGLKWISLFRLDDDNNDCGQTIKALASPSIANDQLSEEEENDSISENTPILMVCTGKGKSRAGVLSCMELLVSGLERGSAIYHVEQAIKRGWTVLLLDPNAHGKMQNQALIRSSLTNFHLNWIEFSSHHPVYILAHSASGGALVRYLLEGDHRQELLSSIQRCVFTDSTHCIEWARQDKMLETFLQSNRVLYIRNCSENPSDTFANHKHKRAGEAHEGNVWWNRRFGAIPTVWAGTESHSAMCWVARYVIWDFFDKDQQP